MDFKDQYKHPLWQKKRLDVLSEHGFFCSSCESEEKQLHVHHKRYVKGRRIWEYNNEEFLVLCNDCHESVHFGKGVFEEVISRGETADYLSYAALLFNVVGASVHPNDHVEQGLDSYNKTLMQIGSFARHAIEGDFREQDVSTILSLSPDRFREIAEYVRSSNGSR